MALYRLYHRVFRRFETLEAKSALEACQKVGWLIGDVWVRIQTRGKYSTGWSNVTRKEGE